MVPNPNDQTCTTYIHCNFGTANVMNCQPGLLFNPSCSCCDWPYNVNCDGGAATTNAPVTGAPTTAGPTTAGPPGPTPAPTTPSPPGPGGKKFVCYYPNWAHWRQGDGNFKVANIDPNLCTHVVYSFAVLDTSNYGLKAHDSWLVQTSLVVLVAKPNPLISLSLLGFGQWLGKFQEIHRTEKPKWGLETPPRRWRLDRLSEQHGRVSPNDGQSGK